MSKTKRQNQVPAVKAGPEMPSPPLARNVSTVPFTWIGIVLLLVALIARIRLLDIPFERDEGVFAYIGRALFEGKRLYTDLYDNKLPGLYLIYGLFGKVFGVLPAGIHLGALLWHLATLTLLFLWLKELLGGDRALASVGLFALYAASGEMLGFAAHATQLCALPAIAGLWALWRGTFQQKQAALGWIFLAGLGAGLAIWIKQQALFYAVFGGLFLSWWMFIRAPREALSRAMAAGALYVCGVILPVGLSAAWFAGQGRFDDFWFWTVEISTGENFKTQSPGGLFFFNFYFPKVIAHWWWVWILGIYGCIRLIRQKERPSFRVLACLLPVSFWGVSLGGAFYPHYFVLALPWLAVCAVMGLDILVQRYGKPGWMVCALVTIWPLLAHAGYWFREDHRTTLRRAYDNNPFYEMELIGKELKKRCKPGDGLAVIGSEPELFLYTGQTSALSHLFFQGLVQPHARRAQFQQQTRAELWGNKPKFVVFPGAQYEHLKDDPLMVEIVDRLQKEYHTIGVVDITDKKSEIIWDPTPEQAVPKTLFWVIVMERN